MATQIASRPPSSYFAGELARTRPRHYTLFMLEPTFILAGFAAPPGKSPPQTILQSLEAMLEFARAVKGREIEVEVDNDERYFIKLGWFERKLSGWKGGGTSKELDGSGWSKGWNQYSKLLWSVL